MNTGSPGINEIKIGWTGSQAQLKVDTSTIGYITTSGSDERLKNNIDTIADKCLKAVESVDMKQFIYKDREYINPNQKISFGIIAQDIKQAFEEQGLDIDNYNLLIYDKVKDEDPNKYYTLIDRDFTMLKLASLTEENKKLKERLDNIEKLLSK